jgi:peptide deformylase
VTSSEVAAREVLRYPHPSLKQRCEPIPPGDELERVARDLLDTMRSFPRCVGLAAPQIDELVRVIAVDVSEHEKATTSHGLLVLANPVVVEAAGDELGREGCLSIPDLTANVRRATWIHVEALGPAGENVAIETGGFEARALLHELDHLDGILFLDRIASRADLFARKRYA